MICGSGFIFIEVESDFQIFEFFAENIRTVSGTVHPRVYDLLRSGLTRRDILAARLPIYINLVKHRREFISVGAFVIKEYKQLPRAGIRRCIQRRIAFEFGKPCFDALNIGQAEHLVGKLDLPLLLCALVIASDDLGCRQAFGVRRF